VIPAYPANSVTIAHADLVAALARIEAVVDIENKVAALVSFSFASKAPQLQLSLPSQFGTVDEILAAIVTGAAAVTTCAQIRHIATLVTDFPGRDIRIACDNGRSPIVITDPADADSALLIVQMPCVPPYTQSQAA
jgi:hypothetical protein